MPLLARSGVEEKRIYYDKFTTHQQRDAETARGAHVGIDRR